MTRQQPFANTFATGSHDRAERRLDLLDRVGHDRRLPLVAITAGLLGSA